ncbi:MAG: polymer-forming cytoskeletal protein [Polyangiaceae bacterium]|jgi:cytoskeletal protein CcmA (bactofilin family)
MSDSINAGHGRKTLVEEGTHFKGALLSSCPIEVKGRIEGDVTAPALVVSASGAVHGRVKVGEIRSQGELAGEFDADVVQLSGTVKDNTVIRAKSLEVKLAPPEGKLQVIFGECHLEIGAEALAVDAGPKTAEIAKAASMRPPVDEGGSSPRVAEMAKAASARPPADANGA